MEQVNITAEVLTKTNTENSTRAKAGFALGLLQIILVEDIDYRFEDLCGDTYNPEACPDIPAEQLAREKRNFRARVNRNGVYGAILQCRSTPTSKWENIESCWGFVGMDFIGSGTDVEFVKYASEWLFANADLPALQAAFQDLM